jgi:hypothetical protein
MVTDLVRVFSVTSTDTRQPGLRAYVITANLVARPDMCLQLQTVNPYAATLCYRAKEVNRSVAVTWEDTPYGPTLRAAHFLKSKDAT